MRASLIVAFTVGLVALPASATAQGMPAVRDTTYRAVDRVFSAWRDTEGPGCSLSVLQRGRVVYERGYGMSNLETDTPIRPSSIFHVASVSKQFTAMAIMLLEHDGKLSVDDNIRKYLPEIPDYGTPITIRHLLTHTSGLRDQWELIGLARGRFEEDRITEADVMDIIPRQRALNFTPGSEYLYSNTGFTLLGVIVKRVSGQTLRAFADARIFKPLGMTSTHFHDDYTMLVPNRTSAYEMRPDGWHVGIPNFDVYGATSLFTTTGDLLKWEANLDHPIIGDSALFAQMATPAKLTTGEPDNYGFGLVSGMYRGARVIEHNGADAGYRSYVGRFPDHALAIAIACNASTANTTALARGVADAYIGKELAPVPPAAPAPQAVTLTPASLERRVGMYLQPNTRVIGEITLRDGHLMLGRAPLVPLSETRFRVAGQPSEIVFADGDHAGFAAQPVGAGNPVPFEWHAPVVATAAILAPYAGSYFSDDLNARYRVTAGDSTISLQTGTSEALTARLMFADTFLGDGWTIQFIRRRGQISGFEVTNSRVRRIAFERLPK